MKKTIFEEKKEDSEFTMRVPDDSIYFMEFFPETEFSVEDAIKLQQDYADPMILNNTKGVVYLDILCNMKTKKQVDIQSQAISSQYLSHISQSYLSHFSQYYLNISVISHNIILISQTFLNLISIYQSNLTILSQCLTQPFLTILSQYFIHITVLYLSGIFSETQN